MKLSGIEVSIDIPKSIILLCVLILPLVDNLTGALFKLGVLSEGAIGSPSQLARVSMLLILFFASFQFSQSRVILFKFFALLGFMLLTESVVAFFHVNPKAYIFGVVFLTKVLFFFLLYEFLKAWIQCRDDAYAFIMKSAVLYGVVISITLIAAYISGFHIPNYEGRGAATRGLFVSGNGIGITLGIACLLSLYANYLSNKLSYLCYSILMLFSIVLIGTKAALVLSIICFSVLAFLCWRRAPILTLILFLSCIFFFYSHLVSFLSLVFENILSKLNSDYDKVQILASSRDVFIKDAFSVINWNDWKSLRFLFGGGAYYSYLDFWYSQSVIRKTLENDFFELFFCYGILMALLFTVLLIRGMVKGILSGKIFIVMCLFLISMHSLLAGHVLFNGTSSIMLSIVLALAFTSTSSDIRDRWAKSG
ncbi:O-antigen ligase family protein [Bowmanella denitrificans]|uniref:O-antigen ligase family protein n=1 Tax=Bowmanella denitrificans TaxID=366582 RepID=UPI0031DA1BF2